MKYNFQKLRFVQCLFGGKYGRCYGERVRAVWSTRWKFPAGATISERYGFLKVLISILFKFILLKKLCSTYFEPTIQRILGLANPPADGSDQPAPRWSLAGRPLISRSNAVWPQEGTPIGKAGLHYYIFKANLPFRPQK